MTEQEITQALQSIVKNQAQSQNPIAVVEQLESTLGLDLSHKAGFIRDQIHSLLVQPSNQPSSYRDHPVQQPNPTVFSYRSDVVPSFLSGDHSQLGAQPDSLNDSGPSKPKKRGGSGGLNKLCGVSPELEAIVGHPTLPRTEIVKQLWAYIRKNNLQDPNNRRKIICNHELRLVFETDCTDMFKMNKLLLKHIIPLEPAKQTIHKKKKANDHSRLKQSASAPCVVISEALASFFGVDVREMLQSEVFARIWGYINVNNLEDPLHPMVILCDAKLRDLFGCQSLPASSIPDILACNHVFRKR